MIFPLIFVTIFFFGCAKPNYVDDSQIAFRDDLSACEFKLKSEYLCMNTKWITYPSESIFGIMELSFTATNEPRQVVSPNHDLSVFLWMPSMGHGSSPVAIEEIYPGKFKISQIYFIMPGAWEIKFQLKEKEKLIEELVYSLTI